MITPPTWALAASDAVRYFALRPWQPRLVFEARPEPLPQRVARLRQAWSQARVSDAERAGQFIPTVLEAAFHRSRMRILNDAVANHLLEIGVGMAVQNDNLFDFPEVDLSRSLTAQEASAVTERLIEVQTRLEHDDRLHAIFSEGLCTIYAGLLDALPDAAFEESTASFSVPLHALLDPCEVVSQIVVTFLQDLVPDTPDAIAALAFQGTRLRIWQNILDVSGLTPEQVERTPNRIVAPADSGLPPDQMIVAYLGGTPFPKIFDLALPFSIPASARSEHILMVARTGSGKTQLIQRDILDNLLAPDSPGMVVIDSQNQMIPNLERLVAARDRIVIIDPFDEAPPALNMFIGHGRDANPHVKEIMEARTLEQFAWIFSALDQELTGRQTTLFTFCARILLAMQANMQTLLDLLGIERLAELRKSPFWSFIEAGDAQTRFFFEHRFCTADYNRTKYGVADRLLGVLRIQAFNRMFVAPANKLDLYAALAARKLVVFNTHKNALGNDASAILGRYAISLYVRAAFEREHDRDPPPAFLYVDEAAEYFGKKDSSDVLFTQLRKYNCGTFVAFQDLSQLGEQQHTLLANTTTKLTGALFHTDARRLAPDMRSSEEELLGIRKHKDSFEIMAYVGNVTPRAVKLAFDWGAVETAPKLSPAEHRDLRQRNQEALTVVDAPQAPPTPSAEDPPSTGPAAPPAPSAAPQMTEPSPPDVPEAPPFEIKPGKDW